VAPDVRDLLRIGAYQLLELSRVPPYAAVQSTVEAAKQAAGAKAAGMVNAVLRRLAEQPTQPGAEGTASDLAARYSHPAWLVARWVARFGRERTEALLRHNNTRPPLVVQPARWTDEMLAQAFDEGGVGWRAAPGGHGLIVEGRQVRDLPGYAEGGFVVQDPAQAHLVSYAALPRGAMVWDACAAPGGKATLLSRWCRVIASDVRRPRFARLEQTVTRAAQDVTLMRADAQAPPFRDGALDAVFVDAPCSATGVMARHPDARWRITGATIEGAVALQRRLLDAVARVVRTGGMLVYLTCSLEPEENAEQVDAFLNRHPEFNREGDDLSLFPPDSGTDGGYGARLRKT
jgi:16S rRNA (cytosine967-C5)-methyltransferase